MAGMDRYGGRDRGQGGYYSGSDSIRSPGDRWRSYQRTLQKDRGRKRVFARLVVFGLVLVVLVLFIRAIGPLFIGGEKHLTEDWSGDALKEKGEKGAGTVEPAISPSGDFDGKPSPGRSWAEALFASPSYGVDVESPIVVTKGGHTYKAYTGLDPALSGLIASRLDKKHCMEAAVVAMEPKTGSLLVMGGFHKKDGGRPPTALRLYPAASIFKIITAAAAVEKEGLSTSSTMYYTGTRYTLYKRQLKEAAARFSNKVSLKDAFAQSINPVFGKLGANKLGGEVLGEYASAFGFGKRISRELPVEASVAPVPKTPYGLAEMGCGFNRRTLISPLHGAVIVSALLNEGMMPEASLVEYVLDASGKEVYRRKQAMMQRICGKKTANILTDMMTETVRSGTSRKIFRRSNRDPVLKKLIIGGKTGSISNSPHTLKYDWFVGYAKDPGTAKSLAISCLAAHQQYIGVRAGEYAKLLMRNYF